MCESDKNRKAMRMKIGKDQKFDATQVSKDGLTSADLKEIAKNNSKVFNVFNQFDANKSGVLEQDELAKLLSSAQSADANKDGKLSGDELTAWAEAFNEDFFNGAELLDRKDMKNVLKTVRKFTKNDEKVSIDKQTEAPDNSQQLVELSEQVNVAINNLANNNRDISKAAPDMFQTKVTEENGDSSSETQASTQEQPQLQFAENKSYVVQSNETINGLIKRSLQAQGIEVNDANMKAALDKFKEDNPGKIHKNKKDVEYLYAGDTVNIPALENGAPARGASQVTQTKNAEKKQSKQDANVNQSAPQGTPAPKPVKTKTPAKFERVLVQPDAPHSNRRDYYTFKYGNGSITPEREDPTYDSDVQIKIGDTTYEFVDKGPLGSTSELDFKWFRERFVNPETGEIKADKAWSNTYYLVSGKTSYPVTIDKETLKLMVEINGQQYDMNQLLSGKMKIVKKVSTGANLNSASATKTNSKKQAKTQTTRDTKTTKKSAFPIVQRDYQGRITEFTTIHGTTKFQYSLYNDTVTETLWVGGKQVGESKTYPVSQMPVK